MTELYEIPLRQKILLSLTALTGLFIMIAYYTVIIGQENLNCTIFIYGYSVPLILLGFDTLIDLDKKIIFAIWATIALFFLLAYYLTNGNPDFTIRRGATFNSSGINKFIHKNSTNSLKALPIFLGTYFIFNSILKKSTGNFIVNTFKQNDLYNDSAKRKIHWYDILTTFTLLAIIILASFF